jgi:hypothetical protein
MTMRAPRSTVRGLDGRQMCGDHPLLYQISMKKPDRVQSLAAEAQDEE